MTSLAIALVIAAATAITGLGLQEQQELLVYAWPAGTTESQKEKILTATSIDDLSVEEYSIAIDRVYEIFDVFDPDSQEYKDLIDCGFVDKEPFEVLQCWDDKWHTVR